MSMQYPLADMLTRIRNAQMAHKVFVDMPASKLKEAVAKVLEREGYIDSYQMIANDAQSVLHIKLRYFEDKPVIVELDCVSRPGLRRYVSKDDIPLVRAGLGIAIISTSKGLVTDRDARTMGIGGEVLCTVF